MAIEAFRRKGINKNLNSRKSGFRADFSSNSLKAGTGVSSKFVDLEEKRKKRKKISFKLKPAKLIVLMLAGYMFFCFGQVYWQICKMNQQIEEYTALKQELLEQKRELQTDIENLKTEEYIERQAREKLGLVMPGEVVVLPAKPGEVIPLDKPETGEIMD